jgi:trk system potassium uptake protein TrkA
MSSLRRILIVGSTPLALFLAARWKDEGHEVTVLDRDGEGPVAFPGATPGERVVGDPLDTSVLHRIGIESTDLMVAATRQDDLNLAAAIACHQAFDVARVFAVVDDPAKADTFADFGVEVLCPTALVAAIIMDASL